MDNSYLKPDPGMYMKPDPEAPSPSALTDDDIYEDTGDLEFNTDPAYEKLFLARIPKYLWQEWSKLDDDAEIHLGTIRITDVTDSSGKTKVGFVRQVGMKKLTMK